MVSPSVMPYWVLFFSLLSNHRANCFHLMFHGALFGVAVYLDISTAGGPVFIIDRDFAIWRKNNRKHDMQEGDRGESDSREGGRDKGTGDERSRCDRR